MLSKVEEFSVLFSLWTEKLYVFENASASTFVCPLHYFVWYECDKTLFIIVAEQVVTLQVVAL